MLDKILEDFIIELINSNGKIDSNIKNIIWNIFKSNSAFSERYTDEDLNNFYNLYMEKCNDQKLLLDFFDAVIIGFGPFLIERILNGEMGYDDRENRRNDYDI